MHGISRRVVLLGGIGCLLAACTNGQSGDLLYSIGVRGEGNQLVIRLESNDGGNGYVVVVHSERGIGEGTITWWGNNSPHQLSFQLHLDALEHFNLRWGEESVTVNVNSTEFFVLESVQSGQQGEVEIDSESPYWIEVKAPTAEQDYFELTAPKAFLDGSPRLFAISWIDYYR
jgi:hypothetical protein